MHIKKFVTKHRLGDPRLKEEDRRYWLDRPPTERIETVELLRRQYYGEAGGFEELLRLLNSHEVDYIIVGAYALAYHGAPRNTTDLDLFIRPVPSNARNIIAALRDFGVETADLSVSDLGQPRTIIRIGEPPLQVDLMTSLWGVNWEEAVSDRVAGAYREVPVHFMGRRTLVKSKRGTGRLQDQADLERLGSPPPA